LCRKIFALKARAMLRPKNAHRLGLLVVVFVVVASVSAPMTPVAAAPVLPRLATTGQSAAVPTLGPYGPCIWGSIRGWHQRGRFGTSQSCQPGPEWHYERRCWIGRGLKYCRFYG
jgi:hypothetical protein